MMLRVGLRVVTGDRRFAKADNVSASGKGQWPGHHIAANHL
jgi:hypothetical protein